MRYKSINQKESNVLLIVCEWSLSEFTQWTDFQIFSKVTAYSVVTPTLSVFFVSCTPYVIVCRLCCDLHGYDLVFNRTEICAILNSWGLSQDNNIPPVTCVFGSKEQPWSSEEQRWYLLFGECFFPEMMHCFLLFADLFGTVSFYF